MEKKVVLVACGTGIATSTVVNDAVTKLAKANNIPVEIIQCKMMEVPGYADRANLLITTTVADKSKYKFPVINARAFLTGIGLDKSICESVIKILIFLIKTYSLYMIHVVNAGIYVIWHFCCGNLR